MSVSRRIMAFGYRDFGFGCGGILASSPITMSAADSSSSAPTSRALSMNNFDCSGLSLLGRAVDFLALSLGAIVRFWWRKLQLGLSGGVRDGQIGNPDARNIM